MKTTSRYLLIFAGLLCGYGRSQSITGDVSVNVTDPNGGTVPGAALELTNTREGTTLAAKVNESGTYTFSQLKPGSYSLRITAPGFQEQRVVSLQRWQA